MENNKSNIQKKYEKFCFVLVIIFIILQGLYNHDSIQAMISALCGITYTFLAGKGLPICYLYGVTGSGFYSFLAYKNALWGNLILYACYYIPMQILGYFRWNKNLKNDKSGIVKVSLSLKEILRLLIVLSLLTIIIYKILVILNDTHPFLDSVTTIFSIGGMYLTVRRAIQQWIFWLFVNIISLIMWLDLALKGERVYSTIIMWFVYIIMAIYFYITWRKEILLKSKH